MHGFNLILEGVRQMRGTSTQPGRRTPTCRSGHERRGRADQRAPAHEGRRGDGDRLAARPTSTSPTSRARSGRARARGELLVQTCADCGRRRMPPRPMCPHCRSIDVKWDAMSGRGPDLVVRRAAPAAAARLRRARALQRDRRRARRGSADPLGRQPRRLGRRARSTRSIPRRSDRRAGAGRVRAGRGRGPAALGARVRDMYPLVPEGVGDYPIKVGSMLLTLVDPHRGQEVAYNRWYERDHFYAGCMIGPWLFAGSRWVATRALKDLRLPADDDDGREPRRRRLATSRSTGCEQATTRTSTSTGPASRSTGSTQTAAGFAERSHVHTVLFDYLGTAYRDADPVPVELALDHGYDGIVLLWFDGTDREARQLHDAARCNTRSRTCSRARTSRSSAVDALARRERTPQRPDGPRQQGRRAGATPPDAVREGRAARHARGRARGTPTASSPRGSRPRVSQHRSSAPSSVLTRTSTSSGEPAVGDDVTKRNAEALSGVSACRSATLRRRFLRCARRGLGSTDG